MPLTSRCLFESTDLRVRHVACCAHHSGTSEVECAPTETVVLPLRGAFAKHLGHAEKVLATPTTALFFAAGRAHRISHPQGLRDESLALDLSPALLQSVLFDVAGADRLGNRRLRPSAVLSTASVTAGKLLAWQLQRGVVDALAVAETAVLLLADAARNALREAPRRHRSGTRKRHDDMMDHVHARLAQPGPPPGLHELSQAASTTPFHLARIFREHTGIALHEYGTRLRLAAAVDALLDSDEGIAAIALAHGFSSHSHFTYAFRRHARVTPQALRALKRSPSRTQMRKIVTALSITSR